MNIYIYIYNFYKSIRKIGRARGGDQSPPLITPVRGAVKEVRGVKGRGKDA